MTSDQRAILLHAQRRAAICCSLILSGLAFLADVRPASAGLVINPYVSANTLRNALLGPNIVSVGSASYTGANVASGHFSGGISAGIGIESGIILTTGFASLAVGPNEDEGATGENFEDGDDDLSDIVGTDTYDATVLEFDFTSTTGNVSFNFVFASEEYNEFVNDEFNDVFAFFLDGDNIALVPSTATPVAINTVNGGNPFGTDATNSQYYNNNSVDDPGPPTFDIQYDGFTDVFTASATGLSPGVHTIRLAIADTADEILDSAVFIQSESFTGGGVVPEPSSLALGLAAAACGAMVLRRRLASH